MQLNTIDKQSIRAEKCCNNKEVKRLSEKELELIEKIGEATSKMSKYPSKKGSNAVVELIDFSEKER